MNKRDAKIAAYRRAAGVVDNALECGWEGLDELYGDDADKVRDALNDLVKSLDARADRLESTG